MRYGESRAQPVVLHNRATVLAAHGAELGQPQGVAVLPRRGRVPANFLPGNGLREKKND